MNRHIVLIPCLALAGSVPLWSWITSSPNGRALSTVSDEPARTTSQAIEGSARGVARISTEALAAHRAPPLSRLEPAASMPPATPEKREHRIDPIVHIPMALDLAQEEWEGASAWEAGLDAGDAGIALAQPEDLVQPEKPWGGIWVDYGGSADSRDSNE